MQESPKLAVIVIGHGSRLPEASRDMDAVVATLERRYGYRMVRACHMEQAVPRLHDAFEECVRAGAQRVVVIPYFLHAGVHIHDDIPALVGGLAESTPDVQVQLGPHLGFDPSLVDLVHRRVVETLEQGGAA